MNLEEKQEQLNIIHERFENAAAGYRKHAICGPGCGYCCTHFGNVDITTMEAMIILQKIDKFPKSQQKVIRKKIDENRRDRERGKAARCPFLNKLERCMIYEVRPFSCRRLYSVKKCEGAGPTIHRQVFELAEETIGEIKRLDPTGYSGHMTYIFHLLNQPAFLKRYLGGGFDPAAILDFGKSHGLVINCQTSRQGRCKK